MNGWMEGGRQGGTEERLEDVKEEGIKRWWNVHVASE